MTAADRLARRAGALIYRGDEEAAEVVLSRVARFAGVPAAEMIYADALDRAYALETDRRLDLARES